MRGMRIIASHRLRPRAFTDREAKTDALGRFAIELPAGDWAIKGVRPDGKIFSVRDITVGGGRITPDVTLTLDPVPPGMPTLDLSPTSDTGPLGDHRTSAARVLLIGRADPNVTIILLPSGARTRSDDAGLLQFPGVALGPGENVVTARVQDAAGHAADATLTITRVGEPSAADPVLAWVRMTLEAIRGDAVAPPVATRDLAIVSAAIFDAVAAIRGTSGYHVHEIAPADASPEAATAAAAHRALVHLYPERAATFDAGLADSLAAVPDGPGKDHGVALGRTVADAILAPCAGDGWADHVVDSPGGGPGTWRPTPPRLDSPLMPQWATVRPFVLASPRQFRPPGPPGLGSRAWADAYNEVKAIGRADSASRTAEQTQIARIWADGAGTYTPPGHWNLIAAQVAQDEGNSLAANARLFAALNLALADAAIACWDAKYAYRFWRPVTAIRAADTDGNPDTGADPSWAPLLTTPNFPEYVSGHSTFSGAAEVVLSSFFGPDVAFSTSSAGLPGVTRSYTSFRRRRRGGRPEPALRRHPLPVLEPGRPRHRPCRGPPCARRPQRRHRRPVARSRGRCPGPRPVSSRAIPPLGRFRVVGRRLRPASRSGGGTGRGRPSKSAVRTATVRPPEGHRASTAVGLVSGRCPLRDGRVISTGSSRSAWRTRPPYGPRTHGPDDARGRSIEVNHRWILLVPGAGRTLLATGWAAMPSSATSPSGPR